MCICMYIYTYIMYINHVCIYLHDVSMIYVCIYVTFNLCIYMCVCVYICLMCIFFNILNYFKLFFKNPLWWKAVTEYQISECSMFGSIWIFDLVVSGCRSYFYPFSSWVSSGCSRGLVVLFLLCSKNLLKMSDNETPNESPVVVFFSISEKWTTTRLCQSCRKVTPVYCLMIFSSNTEWPGVHVRDYLSLCCRCKRRFRPMVQMVLCWR